MDRERRGGKGGRACAEHRDQWEVLSGFAAESRLGRWIDAKVED